MGDQQLPGWYRCSFLLPKKYSFPKLWWWELMWRQEKKPFSLSLLFLLQNRCPQSCRSPVDSLHLMWLLLNPLLSFSISPPPTSSLRTGCRSLLWAPGPQMPLMGRDVDRGGLDQCVSYPCFFRPVDFPQSWASPFLFLVFERRSWTPRLLSSPPLPPKHLGLQLCTHCSWITTCISKTLALAQSRLLLSCSSLCCRIHLSLAL